MKKLKNKIFWTIYIILSCFLITVLFIFNYQEYYQAKLGIEQNLFRINSDRNKGGGKDNNPPIPPKIVGDAEVEKEIESEKKFIDATIYTVLLNNDNDIMEIISHTEDGTIDENIKEIVSNILQKHSKNSTHIGNLYLEKYSYHYSNRNFITIMDNTKINQRLQETLQISIILFLCSEGIIVVICDRLSKWIMNPIVASFQKQKQFIADASHELKTPLSVIMASIEALEEEPSEEKWIENIKSESNRMSKLITSLLDLAKVEEEIHQKSYELTNLSKLVEKAILPLESLIYEKNRSLDYNISKDISFLCNTEEIKQLLGILLDNAIKHSFENGSITVNLKTDRNGIVLEVMNQGNPIPKGEEEKIFERFYRVDKSRNRKENRYGLGLAIAKGIVTNHHGTITAFSNPEYTTFQVKFRK